MNIRKYTIVSSLAAVLLVMACRDESKYPLPYDDRDTGHYLRIYNISANIWSRESLAASAFEAVYESVDAEKGELLDSVSFYASFRRGPGLTREVLVKRVHASDFNFAYVAEPTFSEYLRSVPFRVTATEVLAALTTGASADPDAGGPLVALPVDAGTVLGDLFIIRWRARTIDGQSYTVFNPQTVVNPAFGNLAEANMTPNVTRGQFYNAPYIINFTIGQTVSTAVADPDPYVGDYRMSQVAIWSPNHSVALHLLNMPGHILKPFIFGTSATDSVQTVTLSRVTGGLHSEREFTATYRGQPVTVRLSFEAGQAGLNAAALATLTTATTVDVAPATHAAKGLGFPGGTTLANLGTVFVKLFNTEVECAGNTERQFYQVTPLAGVFNPVVTAHPVTGLAVAPASAIPLAWGAPRSTMPNRGVYRFDRDGKTVGDVFTIGIDDDVDEYGRRNGYCGWYRRVYLRLEKI